MAEGSSNDEDGGSWWSNWIETAKVKSSEALEFMKKDLTEFSQTVQQDTAAAVFTTASILKEKLRVDNPDSVTNKARQGLTTFINTISEVFLPIREAEEDEIFLIHNSQPVLLDRWQSQLHSIRIDPNTYCHEPEGPPEMYESWLEGFDLDSYQDELSYIMINCREVQELYTKLVPSAVSHVEFWQRYYYRVHLLKQAEVKRAEIMKRAEMKIPHEEDAWDDDDDYTGPSSQLPVKLQHEKIQQMSFENSRCSSFNKSLISANKEGMFIKTESNKYQNQINKNYSDVPKIEKSRQNDLLQHEIDEVANHKQQSSQNFEYHSKKYSSPGEEGIQKSLTDNISILKSVGETLQSSESSQNTVSLDASELSLGGIISKDKGDIVVVGTKNDISPASSNTTLRDGSAEDDWEKDFDLEITEEDLKKIENSVKKSVGHTESEEDWENWE